MVESRLLPVAIIMLAVLLIVVIGQWLMRGRPSDEGDEDDDLFTDDVVPTGASPPESISTVEVDVGRSSAFPVAFGDPLRSVTLGLDASARFGEQGDPVIESSDAERPLRPQYSEGALTASILVWLLAFVAIGCVPFAIAGSPEVGESVSGRGWAMLIAMLAAFVQLVPLAIGLSLSKSPDDRAYARVGFLVPAALTCAACLVAWALR